MCAKRESAFQTRWPLKVSYNCIAPAIPVAALCRVFTSYPPRCAHHLGVFHENCLHGPGMAILLAFSSMILSMPSLSIVFSIFSLFCLIFLPKLFSDSLEGDFRPRPLQVELRSQVAMMEITTGFACRGSSASSTRRERSWPHTAMRPKQKVH